MTMPDFLNHSTVYVVFSHAVEAVSSQVSASKMKYFSDTRLKDENETGTLVGQMGEEDQFWVKYA